MSGCRAHGDSIGPYVLGALEPEEMEAMRRHIAGCPRCAAEERSLTDDEVAVLSPTLEDQVLDRFVKERAASAPRRRRWPQLAIAAAAAAALIAGILVATLPGGTDTAYARADLWSRPVAAPRARPRPTRWPPARA